MKNTPNYSLPQFEVDDNFSISDFNEAFSTIDTSISDLQETFNTNGTQGDLIANEVIQARRGENTLGDKIDKIDESLIDVGSSLEDITQIANGTNIAKTINDLINKGHKRIKIASGNFEISESIILVSKVELYGNKDTNLIRTNDIPIIKTKDNTLISECYIHDLSFISINIKNNNYYDLELENANMFKLLNIKVEGVNVDRTSLVGLNAYKTEGVGTAYSLNMDKLDFRNASLIINITDSYLTNSNIWSQDLSNCLWVKCSSQQINNCQFVGNPISGAIKVENPSGGILELIKISNCYLDGSHPNIQSGNGITFKNVYSSSIIGCNIWKQKENGVLLYSCDSVEIMGNSFRDNGVNDDKQYTDISFYLGNANIIVSNNNFLSVEDNKKYKTLAIDLSKSSLVSNSSFTNNLVRESENYSDTPFNFDETRLVEKNNVFINNRKGESLAKAHSNKIVGDLQVTGVMKSKSGMLLNYNFYKDDFNPSIPVVTSNGTKRGSTVTTRTGKINGIAYNISSPLTTNLVPVQISVNGTVKDTININVNKYAEFYQLSSPIMVNRADAISLTIQGRGADTTIRQIQFTLEYEVI